MVLYPNEYFENIKDISFEFLKKHDIHAIILDMDNTLIDYDLNLLEGAKEWCDDLRKKGIKLLIVSNSNKKEKIEKVSNKLELDYILFAMKPLKKGYKKAINKLKENPQNIAAVGDQIFTDVIGANRNKIFSILVEPLNKKDIFVTVLKRPLEKYVLKKYKEKRNK